MKHMAVGPAELQRSGTGQGQSKRVRSEGEEGDMKYMAVGAAEQQRWQTTRWNEKTKEGLDGRDRTGRTDRMDGDAPHTL